MGYDMSCVGDGEYFRLNIWAMGKARGLMDERGMLVYEEPPSWPSLQAHDLTPEVYNAWLEGSETTPEAAERCQRVRAEHDAVLRSHPGEEPGIPYYKLCSNDGWIVLPAECEAAARLARAAGPPEGEWSEPRVEDDISTWEAWIRYLEHCAKNDGFEVW